MERKFIESSCHSSHVEMSEMILRITVEENAILNQVAKEKKISKQKLLYNGLIKDVLAKLDSNSIDIQSAKKQLKDYKPLTNKESTTVILRLPLEERIKINTFIQYFGGTRRQGVLYELFAKDFIKDLQN